MVEELINIDDQLPYNPSDVDIRQQQFSVAHLLDMITNSEIDPFWFEPGYERSGNEWSIEQKSRLIESLIMRIPLPSFYFDGSEHPWKIIDGLQRLSTFYSFLKGMSFELQNLEYLKNFEGKVFFELPYSFRRVIENTIIEAYVINPGTPKKVRYNIFTRINNRGRNA